MIFHMLQSGVLYTYDETLTTLVTVSVIGARDDVLRLLVTVWGTRACNEMLILLVWSSYSVRTVVTKRKARLRIYITGYSLW